MNENLELTIRLDGFLEGKKTLLEESGFVLQEVSLLDDIYMKKKGCFTSYQELLNHCILLRKEGNHFSGFVLTKKQYCDNGDLSKDQKFYLEVPNLEKGQLFLECLDYEFFFQLKQDIYIYKRNNQTLFLQVVEDLGLFVEYESNGETEAEMKLVLETIFHRQFSNYYEKKALEYMKKHHLIKINF